MNGGRFRGFKYMDAKTGTIEIGREGGVSGKLQSTDPQWSPSHLVGLRQNGWTHPGKACPSFVAPGQVRILIDVDFQARPLVASRAATLLDRGREGATLLADAARRKSGPPEGQCSANG